MNNNLDSIDWDFLLNSIAQSNAVLLLGHNVLQGAQEELYAKLRDRLGGDLQHFYARDGLFLFKDGVAKAKAQQEADFGQPRPVHQRRFCQIQAAPAI